MRWSRSRRILEEIVEQPVESGSVPGGFYSRDVASRAAQAGLHVLFNSEPTTATFRVDESPDSRTLQCLSRDVRGGCRVAVSSPPLTVAVRPHSGT